MDIFISYRDSAGAAENEFRKIFANIGHSEWFRLPFIKANAEGWSRMLPGLVCDLAPEINYEKAPAIFMGMLGEQSMLSCVLQESASFIGKPRMARLLRERDSLRGSSVHYRSDRLDFLSEIVDGTVSIQGISSSRGLPHLEWGTPRPAFGFTDSASPHFRFPNLDALDEISYGGRTLLNNRMMDLLTLLDNASEETSGEDVFRKLVRDYHCRFAWASVQLDEVMQISPPYLANASPVFGSPSIDPFRNRENMRDLKSFWEKRALLMRPFGFSPYESLFEQKRPISWPYWLQFLVLISNAGRAKLRKYSFPKLLRFRRSGKGAGRSNHDLEPPDDRAPLPTIGQLFSGPEGPRPVGPELRRRTMRLLRQKGLLLQIRRSLIVPDTDTIYSLYRGAVAPAPATPRKVRGKD
jgi:hypothetical protein